MDSNPVAVITGASTGIGYELARQCVAHGFDIVIAANEERIHHAAGQFREEGAKVDAVNCDLATQKGVDNLLGTIGRRPVEALFANAGTGLGDAFHNQAFDAIRHVIDTNITGTLYLIHRIGNDMRKAGNGRILITGSIAGFIPGTYHAVYNASKSFLDSFSFALRAELKGSGVTVTCLMPGATETDFFDRANMRDTKVGQGKKDDAADVAKQGFDAMMRGEGDVVTGWYNKLQSAIANITPAEFLAEQHRKMAEPGSGARS